jgi:asparagine synthase (glutamine-hydrolysing)
MPPGIRTMSVQFGKCNFDGRTVDASDFDRVRPMLEGYGPDEEGFYCKDNLGILYRAFHTTKESRKETQPHISESGSVITWDGRLDNREALMDELGKEISPGSADLDIVAAAYDCWGVDTLARLLGDWALSIWEPRDRSLTLATDCVGVRHLYYYVEKERVIWCTVLDPLVLLAGHAFQLDQEYIAGWLALFPAPHLTPYAGIHSVPPSSLVRLTKGSQAVTKYWDFDPAKTICYGSDADYEEHFRVALADSVQRRLRSDSPVLAELSGGMDSSSIVCMADRILGRTAADTPRIDTISYYDDSEPNWNERPYFSRVEEKRGRTGRHIDVSGHSTLGFDCSGCSFAATPACASSRDGVTRSFAACLMSGGHRVVLSGIGGDEVTGGVPTPMPELADLLVSCQVRKLTRQLRLWALQKRKPWIHLLLETVKEFLPPELVGISQGSQSASWLSPEFLKQHRAALISSEPRLKFFGGLPSFQANLNTLNALRRQLACYALPSSPTYERRYPYLDRLLLEFLYAIPQEQLVRPGQRRSLMRRALTGIVPDELLNRKRKAYVSAGLKETILEQWRQLDAATHTLACVALGIVENQSMADMVRQVARGTAVPTLTLMRTLTMEAWLRAALRRGVLNGSIACVAQEQPVAQSLWKERLQP